jgi:hypothetical protein
MSNAATESFVPLSPFSFARMDSPARSSTASPTASSPDASGFEALVANSPDPTRSPDPACKPSVTLQRKGDIVTGIRIQCSCGRVTDLTCVY